MPSELDDSDLAETAEQAKSTMDQEASRSGSSSCPDPAASKNCMEKLGLKRLKDKFPFLMEYTDSFIMEAGVHNLIKAEKAARQLKDMERSNKAEDKLFSNRESVDSVLYPVLEGNDNRLSKLHAARCLPRAVCSAGKLWLHARSIMGNKGHPALSSYDLQSIGLGGAVSPKGWVEIHDPSSSNLSIKYFSIGGSLLSKGGKDGQLPDMEDLSEFKNAVRVLRGAMGFVHPWNHSISALENFFHQSSFCQKDLSGTDKQVNTLVKFTDYVLSENASRWRDRECFLTTREIRGIWSDFLNQNQPSKSNQQPSNQQSSRNNSQSSGPQVGSSANKFFRGNQSFGSGPSANQAVGSGHIGSKLPPYMFLEDICVMWNLGRCIKAPGSCTDKKGRQLRHVCHHRPDPLKPHEYCGKNHAACNFH